MRQYTLVFMEQRLGMASLTPIQGDAGLVAFNAMDDEAAMAYITQQHLDRLKTCARADLSSLRIVADTASASGTRLVDDSLSSPHFQDTYVKYNALTQSVEIDFDSTRTVQIEHDAMFTAKRA